MFFIVKNLLIHLYTYESIKEGELLSFEKETKPGQ
ncbi:Hypothetical protein CFV354_1307 [Campylobacter fetus subsp. venerealis NCTC 10354]|nr:Hypothetical protein CFV354_1307 [Campylobacter fetus subsp. venerealis NCTC 10354]